ncbi:MAG TPA: hypothetical protein VFD31_00480 [Thermoleophilaceae bacterium]|nr:hypothetical protein [Thermoleophilaceae bacterium]
MPHAAARALRDDDRREAAPQRRLHVVDSATELDSEPVYAANGRRTVVITGHPVPARRRPSVTATRIQSRPDRVALWAVALGVFLVFMAVATANAASF